MGQKLWFPMISIFWGIQIHSPAILGYASKCQIELGFWPRIMVDDVWWRARVPRPRAPWRLVRTRALEPTLGRHLVSWKACEAARWLSWVMISDDTSLDCCCCCPPGFSFHAVVCLWVITFRSLKEINKAMKRRRHYLQIWHSLLDKLSTINDEYASFTTNSWITRT